MIDPSYITVPIFYFGGFVLAVICSIFAICMAKDRKIAMLLWIAAILLVLIQVGCWALALKTGNAI
jgi:hypothetical protein